jgi:NADH dehydrogenase
MFIAECLKQECVTKVFGQCGHTNYALIDACHRLGIEYVSFRHEQMAAHAADAYYRLSHKLAVLNVHLSPGMTNALTGVFHIKPTPLDTGLRKLADAMPEQTPDQGIGMLKRKRFWVEIAGSPLTPEELFARFRVRFAELAPAAMNLRAEPGTPTMLDLGTTITMALPVRGNVQVRVEKLTLNEAVLVTVAGHPLAGAIRFLSEQISDLIRFQIQVYDRPANLADWFVMRTVGEGLQSTSWEGLLEAVLAESGGAAASPMKHEEESLTDDRALLVEAWLKELITERRRASQARKSSFHVTPQTDRASCS